MDSNIFRIGYKIGMNEPPQRGVYRRIDCQRKMVEKLVEELQPGHPYVIRLSEWQQRYVTDEHGLHMLHELDVDIRRALTMNVVIPVMPDYSALRMIPLTVTAWDEIKHRLRNTIRYRGWRALASSFFHTLEEPRGRR